jgi:hypothetical protein
VSDPDPVEPLPEIVVVTGEESERGPVTVASVDTLPIAIRLAMQGIRVGAEIVVGGEAQAITALRSLDDSRHFAARGLDAMTREAIEVRAFDRGPDPTPAMYRPIRRPHDTRSDRRRLEGKRRRR